MIKSYETTFIVDAHLSNEQIESTISKYSKIITDNGGTIKLIDRWGKRRLAYEIAKKQYGYYVYLRFDAEGTIIQPLEREYKLDDQIIRHLTVTVPKVVVASETEPKPAESVESESEDNLKPVEPVKLMDASDSEKDKDQDDGVIGAEEESDAVKDEEKSE